MYIISWFLITCAHYHIVYGVTNIWKPVMIKSIEITRFVIEITRFVSLFTSLSVTPVPFIYTDCPLNVTLPDLSTYPLTCQLHGSCTSVECCMEVPFIGRRLTAMLELNQDTQILNIGIEKLQFPISLLDFKFGMCSC